MMMVVGAEGREDSKCPSYLPYVQQHTSTPWLQDPSGQLCQDSWDASYTGHDQPDFELVENIADSCSKG